MNALRNQFTAEKLNNLFSISFHKAVKNLLTLRNPN